GSGQVSLDQLKTICSWKDGQEPQDFLLLRKLSKLPGYDVFTLRILFRELAIPLNDNDALRLSENQQKELTAYVSRCTRPLISSIYGDKESELKSFEDVIRLFRDPDTRKVRKKLTTMAKSLDMEVEDIPRFLEDYGDLFLAISYFQKCFDQT